MVGVSRKSLLGALGFLVLTRRQYVISTSCKDRRNVVPAARRGLELAGTPGWTRLLVREVRAGLERAPRASRRIRSLRSWYRRAARRPRITTASARLALNGRNYQAVFARLDRNERKTEFRPGARPSPVPSALLPTCALGSTSARRRCQRRLA